MTKDRKVSLASQAPQDQLVQQDQQALELPVLPERLAQRAPLVLKERQVLQEILVRLGLQARRVTQVQLDPLVLQAQRVLREQQVQQDLKVLQEIREQLDQRVR
jgi:hypothetical protein